MHEEFFMIRLSKPRWLNSVRDRASVRYGVAIVASAFLVALRDVMAGVVAPPESPFLLLTIGVAAVAWFGGWGPGTLATVLTTFATYTLLVDSDLGNLDTSATIRITVFILQGVLLSVLIDLLVQARKERTLRARARELRSSAAISVLGAGSSDDAADALLRTFATRFDAVVALLWRVEGGAMVCETTSLTAELGSLEHGDASGVATFERLRRIEQLTDDDIVSRAARGAVALVAADDRDPPRVRSVMAVPIVLDVDTPIGRVIVLELHRRRPFAPEDVTVDVLRDLGAEIGRCIRGRAAEWTVAVLHERLSERAQELEAILDTSPIGIAVSLDDDCEMMRVNDAGRLMLGLDLIPKNDVGTSRDDARDDSPVTADVEGGGSSSAVLHPCVSTLQSAMLSARTSRETVGPVEVEIERPDGTRRNVLEYASPLFDSQRRVRGCVGAFVDTTALRDAELALRERERVYRASFERAGVGQAHLNLESGQFELVNRRLTTMLGYTPKALVGRTLQEVVNPGHRESIDRMLERLRRGEADEFEHELEFVRQDGASVFGAMSATVGGGPTSAPTHLVAVVQDVTDRARAVSDLERHRSQLEEIVAERTAALEASHHQLRLSERMAALGTFSAGLGHDMGNLLLPVRLRLESMMLKGMPANLEEDVQAIAKCAEYLQRLANGLRLLALDPEAPSTQESTNLDTWWTDIESFLRNSMPRSAELVRQFDEGLPAIAVSRHRLTQAVFNLVQNAGEAIRERDGGWVRLSAIHNKDDSTLQISVVDNGVGMSPEVRARCLEPFFTRKTRGLSTGLGLSLVHGIVLKSKGSISVESEVGRGTRFTLKFPAVIANPHTSKGNAFGPPVKALVSYAQHRLSNYAVTVARAIGAEVEQVTASTMATLDFGDDARPLLWIADAADLSEGLVQTFMRKPSDGARRVLVFGEFPDSQHTLPGVECIGQPTPSKIRSALRQTIVSLIEESDLACDAARRSNEPLIDPVRTEH